MPAHHCDNPATRDTVWRVYDLPEFLRVTVQARRQALGQTVREFINAAIEHELPQILAGLRELLPPPASADECRPARLPLSQDLLGTLRQGSEETGLPGSLLLLACLARAARRKRRPRGSSIVSRGKRRPDGRGAASGQARGGSRQLSGHG